MLSIIGYTHFSFVLSTIGGPMRFTYIAITLIAVVLDYLSPSLAETSATEDGNEYIQTTPQHLFGIVRAGTLRRINWYVLGDHTQVDHPCNLSDSPYERGTASWYGPGFHGKLAANGKPFDMEAATVAHKELPLGTRLCIKNPANGRVVIATVTDRGPFIKGRIIDLSKGVARALEIDGLAKVEIFL